MSWRDIIIGDGDWKSTACISRQDLKNVSQNSNSFWISNCVFGIGMTIFKNTEEGKMLAVMFKENAAAEDIQKFIDAIALRRAPIELAYKAIAVAKAKHFEEGREAKTVEMREVLGL